MNLMTAKKCIYCKEVLKKASLEHIVPAALGGTLLDSQFKTRSVCARCNSLLGLFVDGLYIKSFFSLSNKWLGINKEVLKTSPTTFPLLYFGYLDVDKKLGFENCELWISPCKGRVFHFHNNNGKEFYGYAGGDPRSRKSSPGVALFVNTTDDIELLELGLRSYYKHFSKSERVVSHIDFQNEIPPKLGRLPNTKETEWIEWYHDEIGTKCKNRHKCSFSIQIGYSDRMMAKIALGVGFNLFGEDYLNSECYNKLREYMWQKDLEARNNIGVLRHDTFPQRDGIFSVLNPSIKDVTIFVTLQSIGVILSMIIYGDEQSIAITTNTDFKLKFWENFKYGFVYQISPMYNLCNGPTEFTKYIALMQSKNYS